MAGEPDIIIVGGGIVGCAAAYELARAGASCCLLDSGEIGREASWASVGLVTHPLPRRSPFQQLRRAGHAYFHKVALELQEEVDIDFEYHETGTIEPIIDESQEKPLPKLERRFVEAGLPFRHLTRDEALERVPQLSPGIRGALFWENERQVRNHRFVRALARAAASHGCDVRPRTRVMRVTRDADRILGVETPEYELHAAEVVIAAGAWSRELAATAGIELPVEPVRGQVLLFEGPRGILRHNIHGPDVYCVPRLDGKILVGTTAEHVGFDKRVTLAGIHEIMSRAINIAPGLEGLTFLSAWAGLRPYADRQGGPLLGRITGLDGLVIATGHYRSGILLGPITGRLVKELLVDRETSIALEPFRPDR